MAFASSCHRDPAVSLSVRWAGRRRTLAFSNRAAVVLAALLPFLAACYLAGTLYFLFHDQVLASLMLRQTDIQYAYEDRIAALKTQLDQATSRGLVDRDTLETSIRALTAKGAQLEAHAASIDMLVNESMRRSPDRSLSASAHSMSSLLDTPSLAPSPVPPLESGADTEHPSRSRHGVDLSALGDGGDWAAPASRASRSGLDAVAASLAHAEAKQAQTVAHLRERMIGSVERMQTALAETGLPTDRWQNRSSSEAGVGGPFVPLSPEGSAGADGSSVGETITLLDGVAREHMRLGEVVDRVPLRKPLRGPVEVTSTFGPRLDPFFGRPAMHTGIDLHENEGDDVAATAAGIVTIAGSEGGYGNMVEIDHGHGLATRYAHLSAIEVAVHQKIAPGDVVGRVGATGRATGPHLHYETRINGEAVDPARFLRAGSALFPG